MQFMLLQMYTRLKSFGSSVRVPAERNAPTGMWISSSSLVPVSVIATTRQSDKGFPLFSDTPPASFQRGFCVVPLGSRAGFAGRQLRYEKRRCQLSRRRQVCTHDACNRPHQGTLRWFGTFSCKISIVESEEERIQSIGS